MAKEGTGWLARIASTWRKASPEEILSDMKAQKMELEKERAGIEYDQRRLHKEYDLAKRKGVNAIHGGRNLEAEEAAYEMEMIKRDLGDLRRYRNLVLKSRIFCRTAERKLKYTMPGGRISVVAEIGRLMNDNEIAGMMENANVQLSEFEEALTKRLDIDKAILEDDLELEDENVSETLAGLKALADAERSGDTKKVEETSAELDADLEAFS